MSAVAYALAPVSLVVSCHRCEDEVWHCHGALVRHLDGSTCCLDNAACQADEMQHDFTGSCAQLLVDCGC